jgi:hypothetical protein
VSRLTKQLVWTAANEPAPENVRTQFGLTATSRVATKAKPSVAAAAQCPEALHLDITLPTREQAVYLLHVGAEVEHALMAQYLSRRTLWAVPNCLGNNRSWSDNGVM